MKLHCEKDTDKNLPVPMRAENAGVSHYIVIRDVDTLSGLCTNWKRTRASPDPDLSFLYISGH